MHIPNKQHPWVINPRLKVSREDARGLKMPFYYTGQPCKNRHISKRRTSTGACLSCVYERSEKAYRARDPFQKGTEAKKGIDKFMFDRELKSIDKECGFDYE